MLALLSLLCWKFPSGFQVGLLKASYLLSWVQEAKNPPCFTRDYFKQIPFFLRFPEYPEAPGPARRWASLSPYKAGTWQFSREGLVSLDPWAADPYTCWVLVIEWVSFFPVATQARPWLHNPCCQSNPGRNKISFEPTQTIILPGKEEYSTRVNKFWELRLKRPRYHLEMFHFSLENQRPLNLYGLQIA